MNDIGHWQFFKEFDPNDWVGFIYKIIDLDTQQMYIGKKFFHSTTRKIVKGRKNRKKIVKESKWRSYTGSCNALNAEIALRGKDRFQFYIESLHESRGSLAWTEVYRLVTENALREKLSNGRKKFYNGLIPPVKFIPPAETFSESEHKYYPKNHK